MTQDSYLVLARKYRPQNFEEVMGQEVLVTTLSNSIKNDRLHHAYILTGIRGVGKTTTARIIAKTLNCTDENATKNATACGICDNCKAIAASKHQDVIEIDAASRTGVDDIREIIDSVAYAPVMAKYKIYIIDEVHMLSNSAFNALLKTLEEPPTHVKFIFATTEIKKVPITILSRCQRFDLRRLSEEEIASHIKNILKKENFEADEEGVNLIAKMSEGSVRDSLSLVDQALSANNHEKHLSTQKITEMLGLNDRVKVSEFFELLLKGETQNAIIKFEEIYAFSSDILQLIQDLMEITHKTVKIKLIKEEKAAEFPASIFDKLKEIADKISLAALTKLWQMLLKANQEISFSNSPKITFEMLIVRICHLSNLPDLKNIVIAANSNSFLENENNSQKKLDEKEILVKDINNDKTENDLAQEILRNFEGAKLIS